MPRVLFLSTDLERGGLPLRLCRLVLQLRDRGVLPIVGCLTRPGPLSDELASAGIETFACNGRGGLDVSCIWRLAEHVRRYDPDLIHASLFHANVAARLVGRIGRNRPIITSTVTIEIERPLHRIGEWATAGFSDVHVANAEAVARHLRDDLVFPPDRVVVIPNAIDAGECDRAEPIQRGEFGISNETPLIVWAGRMDPVKDLATLVRAIATVAKERPIAAVLLGDGPEMHHVKKLIQESGAAESFLLPGWSHRIAGWLKAADVMLLTSRTEGCPNVLIEAMACRCPVIASDIAPCRELVTHGIEGLLASVGDAEAFAAGIVNVLDDREGAATRSRAARNRILKSHDIRSVSKLWVELYERLLGRHF